MRPFDSKQTNNKDIYFQQNAGQGTNRTNVSLGFCN